MEIFFLFVIFMMAFAIGLDVFQIMRNGKSWSITKTLGYSIVFAFATLGLFMLLVSVF